MPPESLLFVIIGLTLVFDFFNGMNDSGNIVATVVSSGGLTPRKALTLASIAEFLGPFLLGVAVATRIGSGIVDPSLVTPVTLLAAVLAALSWSVFTAYTGIPSSSSHALVGGIVGAVAIANGIGSINAGGVLVIVLALVVSPVLGFVLSYVAMRGAYLALQGATPRVNLHLRRGQIATSLGLAVSHGANDAQKTMGVITLALVSFGLLP